MEMTPTPELEAAVERLKEPMSARETAARLIDPETWRVLDEYKRHVDARMPSHGIPADRFTDAKSLAIADAVLASLPTGDMASRDHAPGEQRQGESGEFTHLSDDQQADIRKHIAGLSEPEEDTYEAPVHGWTCFHCGQTFTTYRGAGLHFGKDVKGRPICHDPDALVDEYDAALSVLSKASPAIIGYENKLLRASEARRAILSALSSAKPDEGDGSRDDQSLPTGTGEREGWQPLAWHWVEVDSLARRYVVAMYGDYKCEVTLGHGGDGWSAKVNNQGVLAQGSEEEARAWCERRVLADIGKRIAAADETLALYASPSSTRNVK